MVYSETPAGSERSVSTVRKSPAWNRDELILALDLYMRHRPTFPSDNHPDVIALSVLLNHLALNIGTHGLAKFRNPNGVAMKLQNLRRLDPDQGGKGLRSGGREEVEVWGTFAGDPERLLATAAAIRDAIVSPSGIPLPLGDEDDTADEGKVLTRLHRTRERDRGIVERRKAMALREHGTLRCQACGFDFTARYGDRGSGFIECHHTKPVSALKAGDRTKIGELALLCANCHRMIHVARPWLSIDELKAVLIG